MFVTDLHSHERATGCAKAGWYQLPMVCGVVDHRYAGDEEHYHCPGAGTDCLVLVDCPEIVCIAHVCGKQCYECDHIVQHGVSVCVSGAPTTIRTPDILITKQVLCQLSYKGIVR